MASQSGSSFSKLRKLRDELCKGKSDHDSIDEIRDQLISELISTREILKNSESDFDSTVIEKVNSMLSLLREDGSRNE